MIRTRSVQWLWVGIVMGAVVGAVVLLIISGTFAASAQLWDVDSASDLEIGSEQQQVVTNIEVLDSNEPVEIHVGDLVDSGAELDHNATSYRIDIDEKTNRSEVYIENPNSSNATVVVSASAISSPGRFDLYISNIDTTNVSKYDEEGAKINRDLSYTAEQGGKKASVGFSISSLGSIGFKSDTYNQSTQSVFYNYSTNNNQSPNTAVTIWEEEQDGSLGEKIKTVETSSKNISLRDTDIEGETKIIIGLHSSPDKHSFNAIYALDSTSINVSVPAQLVGGPFYYSRTDVDKGSDGTLLFEFNTNISRSQGYITTKLSNNRTENISLKNHPETFDIKGDFLYVYPLTAANISTKDIQPVINNIEVGGIVSTSSSNPYKNQFSSPVRVDNLVYSGKRDTINQGSNIGLRLEQQYGYNLSKLNGSLVKQIDSTGLNTIHTIRTEGLSPGHYSVNSNSGTENITFQLIDSSIHFETADTVNGSQIPIHIGSTGTNRTAVLNVSKTNSGMIFRTEIMLNNASNVSRYIPVSQPGTYSVELHDLDTNITTTQDVEVLKDRNPTVRAAIHEKSHSGSHLDLVLNSTYDTSSITLMSQNNTTTTLELKTIETGPTPVTVNTYASPESPSKFVTTGSGIDVESVTGDTAPLSPGTYDLSLRSEHGTEVANDTATVTVEPRSTSDLTAYTTRSVASGEFENASAVREAIADGTLTPATTATANDTVVYAVNATGLTGLPAAANASLERGADLDRLDGLSFGVAPTGADDGDESTDGDGLGRTLNGSGIHLDRQGLYLVVDGERAFGTETLPEPGATFEAEFRVDDDRLRRTAADDRHRAATELTYATDSTDGSIATESGDDSTEASGSTDSEASGSTSSTGGSDAIGGGSAGGGSTGGSSTGGGSTGGSSTGGSSTGGSSTGGGSTGGSSTGGPSAPGGGAGPAGSAAAGNATNAGGSAPSEESLGPDANRPAPRLGMGISIAPGTSEIPPSVGPPEVFGTGGPERGAGGPTGVESRSEHGRPNDAGGGEGDDATSAGPADSVESPESSAAGDQSATGDSSPDEADASDLGYDEAPIRSTAYDLPGFDAVASLAALAGASLLARRRGRES